MLVVTFHADLGLIAEKNYANDIATNQTTLTDMIMVCLTLALTSWWANNIPKPALVGGLIIFQNLLSLVLRLPFLVLSKHIVLHVQLMNT